MDLNVYLTHTHTHTASLSPSRCCCWTSRSTWPPRRPRSPCCDPAAPGRSRCHGEEAASRPRRRTTARGSEASGRLRRHNDRRYDGSTYSWCVCTRLIGQSSPLVHHQPVTEHGSRSRSRLQEPVASNGLTWQPASSQRVPRQVSVHAVGRQVGHVTQHPAAHFQVGRVGSARVT